MRDFIVYDNISQASGGRMEINFKINDILRKHLKRNFKNSRKSPDTNELSHKLVMLYVMPLNFTLR